MFTTYTRNFKCISLKVSDILFEISIKFYTKFPLTLLLIFSKFRHIFPKYSQNFLAILPKILMYIILFSSLFISRKINLNSCEAEVLKIFIGLPYRAKLSIIHFVFGELMNFLFLLCRLNSIYMSRNMF